MTDMTDGSTEMTMWQFRRIECDNFFLLSRTGTNEVDIKTGAFKFRRGMSALQADKTAG